MMSKKVKQVERKKEEVRVSQEKKWRREEGVREI